MTRTRTCIGLREVYPYFPLFRSLVEAITSCSLTDCRSMQISDLSTNNVVHLQVSYNSP